MHDGFEISVFFFAHVLSLSLLSLQCYYSSTEADWIVSCFQTEACANMDTF